MCEITVPAITPFLSNISPCPSLPACAGVEYADNASRTSVPAGPVAPLGPVAPAGPVAPLGPVAPAGPVEPFIYAQH